MVLEKFYFNLMMDQSLQATRSAFVHASKGQLKLSHTESRKLVEGLEVAAHMTKDTVDFAFKEEIENRISFNAGQHS